MKILFIGCVESSHRLLEALLADNFNIVGVVTKKESSENADFKDLAPLSRQYHIDCHYVKHINSIDSFDYIKEKKPDIIYCFGWSQLIKEEILQIPPMGAVGLHPAQLPCNRGRHPLIWALALGLTQTASTFFRMDSGADSGDILSQETIEISYDDYARDLYDKVIAAAEKQVVRLTIELESGKCNAVKQEDTGNRWRKRGIEDGTIDWRMSSRAIYNLVRSLGEPYPGAQFCYNGSHYIIYRTEEVSSEGYGNLEPGKVIKVVSETEFYIKAYDNLIHVMKCDPVSLKEGEYLR